MKILQRIVDGRVSIAGFVPERDTTDAIFVVREMQEKCPAVNKHTYMAFLVLENELTAFLEYLSGGS